MANKTFVADIQPNQEVSSLFVVAEKQLRTAKTGNVYLTVKLVDKTGEITARLWEKAEEAAAALVVKNPVFVRARCDVFRDERQLQIREIRPESLCKIDPSDFLPTCPLDTDLLWERMKRALSGIKRRSFQGLIRLILGDEELMERFKRAPAAKSMHHAYLGGLLEHTVAVTELTALLCDRYPDLDRDLLLAGAFLHDMGKVDEFDYSLAIDYSHAGRLLGHIVMGVQIVDEKLQSLKNFPTQEAWVLKHLILSHHGETDLGAVRLPMTREAFVLHFADDLDAKMNGLKRILSESPEGDVWTPYQKIYERFFLRGFPAELMVPEASGPSPTAERDDDNECGQQLSLWSVKKHLATKGHETTRNNEETYERDGGGDR